MNSDTPSYKPRKSLEDYPPGSPEAKAAEAQNIQVVTEEADRKTEKERVTALPAIEIRWDEKRQSVYIQFENEAFRTWQFVIACLNMAKGICEQNERLAQVAAMQMQQQAAMQAEINAAQNGAAIRKKLELGR